MVGSINTRIQGRKKKNQEPSYLLRKLTILWETAQLGSLDERSLRYLYVHKKINFLCY